MVFVQAYVVAQVRLPKSIRMTVNGMTIFHEEYTHSNVGSVHNYYSDSSEWWDSDEQNYRRNGVYYNFEVADVARGPVDKKDLSTIYLCDEWDHGGHKDWRIPTQRELMLIYVLRSDGQLGNIIPSYVYWSTTKDDTVNHFDYLWCVDFSTGATYPSKGRHSVLCVRSIL